MDGWWYVWGNVSSSAFLMRHTFIFQCRHECVFFLLFGKERSERGGKCEIKKRAFYRHFYDPRSTHYSSIFIAGHMPNIMINMQAKIRNIWCSAASIVAVTLSAEQSWPLVTQPLLLWRFFSQIRAFIFQVLSFYIIFCILIYYVSLTFNFQEKGVVFLSRSFLKSCASKKWSNIIIIERNVRISKKVWWLMKFTTNIFCKRKLLCNFDDINLSKSLNYSNFLFAGYLIAMAMAISAKASSNIVWCILAKNSPMTRSKKWLPKRTPTTMGK